MKSITIIGKRWFDKVNGNTYFSSVGLIDGKEVVFIPFEYGYGDHYLNRTFDEMANKGLIIGAEKYPNGGYEPFWVYCDRLNINKYNCVTDVARKKDL